MIIASKGLALWVSGGLVTTAVVGGIVAYKASSSSPVSSTTTPTNGGGTISAGSNSSAGSNGNGNGNGNSNGGHPITLTGAVAGKLVLGSPSTVTVTVNNPNNQDIAVTSVTGAITSVTSAGLAGRPVCSASWYNVGSFTGTKTIAKNTNGQFSIPVTLANLPSTNQDNCKGSTVRLNFTAQAQQA
jgi:hypothetical protein